jgi:hypothetical protein
MPESYCHPNSDEEVVDALGVSGEPETQANVRDAVPEATRMTRDTPEAHARGLLTTRSCGSWRGVLRKTPHSDSRTSEAYR